jgi:RNA polymerase sigma factor (sigma-70 family)
MRIFLTIHIMVDKRLFEQCKLNDGRAQRALYDHYKARLMGLCRRYAKDRDDAQDMLQEAFIKIFSHISQVKCFESFEGWMRSVAIRTAIDHYNKKKRADLFSNPYQEYETVGGGHDIILDNISDEYLITIVNDLPEGCRLVFNLSVVEGYNHVEIAAMLSVTESTSRSQLHYAKQLLKEKLNRIGIKRYEKIA